MIQARVGVHGQQFPLDLRDLLGPGRPRSAPPPPPRRAPRSSAGNRTAPHPRRAGPTAGSPVCEAISSPCAGDQLRQPVDAVHHDRPLPGQVVEADVVQQDLVRLDAEQPGEQPLEPDGHVAQADRAVPGVQQGAGDDADRVGEVDDPGAGVGPLPGPFRDVQHDRHRAQRLGQPARAGRLLADAAALQRPGLVPLPGGLAADPELEQDRARPVEPFIQVWSSS